MYGGAGGELGRSMASKAGPQRQRVASVAVIDSKPKRP